MAALNLSVAASSYVVATVCAQPMAKRLAVCYHVHVYVRTWRRHVTRSTERRGDSAQCGCPLFTIII